MTEEKNAAAELRQLMKETSGKCFHQELDEIKEAIPKAMTVEEATALRDRAQEILVEQYVENTRATRRLGELYRELSAEEAKTAVREANLSASSIKQMKLIASLDQKTFDEYLDACIRERRVPSLNALAKKARK